MNPADEPNTTQQNESPEATDTAGAAPPARSRESSGRLGIFVQLTLTMVLLAGNLVAMNVLFAETPIFRYDLTEDQEYTLTSVTRDLIGNLEEDLYLYGYFTERSHPFLAPLIPSIRDMMEEYAVLSDGKVQVIFADPRLDEELEIEAKQRFGVNPIPFEVADKFDKSIINSYFHIVVAYGDQYVRYDYRNLVDIQPNADGTQVEVTLRNLEYDLTKAMRKVVFGFQSIDALFADLEKDVEVVAYISDPESLPDEAKQIPELLGNVCESMAEGSGGKFRYRLEDPPTDPREQQQLYEQYEIRPFSMGFLETTTFYCSALLRIGDEIEPLYLLERESVSEASIREGIESSLRRAVPGFVKTIGIARPEPALPPEIARQMGQQPEIPDFEALRAFAEADYGVEWVDLEEGVDPNLDMLWVVRPGALGEEAIFNLDQYLMRGGKVVVALDRFQLDRNTSTRSRYAIKENASPEIDAWLAHFGVKPDSQLVKDDRNQRHAIPQVRQRGILQFTDYIYVDYPWFVRTSREKHADHPAVSRLESVTFYWPTALELDETVSEGVLATRLIQSSDRAWKTPNQDVNAPITAQQNRRWYTIPETTESVPLAVALTGSFSSYYNDHEPPVVSEPVEEEDPAEDEEAQDDAQDDAEEEPVEARRSFISQSPDTRLVVLSDAEMFSEQFASLRPAGTEFESNMQFALNLIDWSVEDNDMIKIRSRGATARPLDLEGYSKASVDLVNFVVPCTVILLLGLVQLFLRRNRRPMSLTS